MAARSATRRPLRVSAKRSTAELASGPAHPRTSGPGGMTSTATLAGCREVRSHSPLSADSLAGWRVAFESSAQLHDPDPVPARRQVVYFAKAEYFTQPGMRGRFVVRCCRAR